MGLGFGVWGLGFRVWGSGFRVWGLGFWFLNSGLPGRGPGFAPAIFVKKQSSIFYFNYLNYFYQCKFVVAQYTT